MVKKKGAMIALDVRRKMVDPKDDSFSIKDQCSMLQIHRSGLYYKPASCSNTDLEIMRVMDEMYLEDPTRGTRRYCDDLQLRGIQIGREKARTLMNRMGIHALYCKPRTTVLDRTKYKYPYLLRNLYVHRPNQVWCIDISYIPMQNGFMYLCVIIDLHSRYIVGWSLSNCMEASWVVETIKAAVERHGAPEIINSDQGVQFTSDEYTAYIKSLETVRISMDGKGRATDNAHVERFFRTIKYDKLYRFVPTDGLELYSLCDEYIRFYNTSRSHSSIGKVTPEKVYKTAA
jgi:putative transposase